MAEDRNRKGAGSSHSGAADHSRSKIPQFKAGFNGANINPANHVFQGDKRANGGKGPILRLNRDGDIRVSAENFKHRLHRTPGYMNLILAHNLRRDGLNELIARINYHTGLDLRLSDFAVTDQARDRTAMWKNEEIPVGWEFQRQVELRIPNKDHTKAPTSVKANVSITMNSHDAHENAGPNCPHYGATIQVDAPDKVDVTWAAEGVKTFEEQKAGEEKASPRITEKLVLHVLVDVVPASQSKEELSRASLAEARRWSRPVSGDEAEEEDEEKKGRKQPPKEA